MVQPPLKADQPPLAAVRASRHDMTDARGLEETLIRRHEHLSILNAIARTVNQSLDLADILNRALDIGYGASVVAG